MLCFCFFSEILPIQKFVSSAGIFLICICQRTFHNRHNFGPEGAAICLRARPAANHVFVVRCRASIVSVYSVPVDVPEMCHYR